VAFPGERGAYSEEAAVAYFSVNIDTVPCRTVSQVFWKVENSDVGYGVVPVENSTEGGVNETYDLLLETELRVSGEVNLRIIHCLISHHNRKIEDLKVIYSHPQALAQCRRFLDKLSCELVPTFDTAGSVKMIKEEELVDAGAIASERSAQIYAMDILAKGIEDSPTNNTRFLVLSHNDSQPTGKDKCSVIFSTKHAPGALYNALREFALRKINLTMIVSRPTKMIPWEYNFYVDFDGHQSSKVVQECLTSLANHTTFLKVLGSYSGSQDS